MAFKTDAQRRWWFAHLGRGMRRIAGKMREHHKNSEIRDTLRQAMSDWNAATEEQRQRALSAAAKSAAEVEKYWKGSISGSAPVDRAGKAVEGKLAVTGTPTRSRLTRATVVKNLMAGKSASGVELDKKRKQNAVRRARYQMMKDMYGHRTRSGGWE